MENLLKILTKNLKKFEKFKLKFVSIFKTFGNFLKILCKYFEKIEHF